MRCSKAVQNAQVNLPKTPLLAYLSTPIDDTDRIKLETTTVMTLWSRLRIDTIDSDVQKTPLQRRKTNIDCHTNKKVIHSASHSSKIRYDLASLGLSVYLSTSSESLSIPFVLAFSASRLFSLIMPFLPNNPSNNGNGMIAMLTTA